MFKNTIFQIKMIILFLASACFIPFLNGMELRLATLLETPELYLEPQPDTNYIELSDYVLGENSIAFVNKADNQLHHYIFSVADAMKMRAAINTNETCHCTSKKQNTEEIVHIKFSLPEQIDNAILELDQSVPSGPDEFRKKNIKQLPVDFIVPSQNNKLYQISYESPDGDKLITKNLSSEAIASICNSVILKDATDEQAALFITREGNEPFKVMSTTINDSTLKKFPRRQNQKPISIPQAPQPLAKEEKKVVSKKSFYSKDLEIYREIKQYWEQEKVKELGINDDLETILNYSPPSQEEISQQVNEIARAMRNDQGDNGVLELNSESINKIIADNKLHEKNEAQQKLSALYKNILSEQAINKRYKSILFDLFVGDIKSIKDLNTDIQAERKKIEIIVHPDVNDQACTLNNIFTTMEQKLNAKIDLFRERKKQHIEDLITELIMPVPMEYIAAAISSLADALDIYGVKEKIGLKREINFIKNQTNDSQLFEMRLRKQTECPNINPLPNNYFNNYLEKTYEQKK